MLPPSISAAAVHLKADRGATTSLDHPASLHTWRTPASSNPSQRTVSPVVVGPTLHDLMYWSRATVRQRHPAQPCFHFHWATTWPH